MHMHKYIFTKAPQNIQLVLHIYIYIQVYSLAQDTCFRNRQELLIKDHNDQFDLVFQSKCFQLFQLNICLLEYSYKIRINYLNTHKNYYQNRNQNFMTLSCVQLLSLHGIHIILHNLSICIKDLNQDEQKFKRPSEIIRSEKDRTFSVWPAS